MKTEQNRYNEELAQFGVRAKMFRLNLGLTQLELAENIGVERSEISKIENGKSNIQFRTIVRLAEALNIPTIELFLSSQ